MEDITTRTLDAEGMTPARAYAALRAKAAGRTSYLIASHEPDEQGQQRSVIGFLTKDEAAFPPPVEALQEIAAAAASMPAPTGDPAIDASCCRDALSVVLFDAAVLAHGLKPWADLPFIGREIRRVASIVFDHVAGTFTIAATNTNVVDRVASTIAAAPALASLPPVTGDRPEHLFEQPPMADFTKQLSKAARRVAMGGLDRLRFGRRFSAPARGADLFDVMRALADAAPARHTVFVEHAGSPLFPAYSIAGLAGPAVRLEATLGADALAKELLALFPIERLCGTPPKEALAAFRDIATTGIGVRGASVLRTRPGGVIDALTLTAMVTLDEEQLHVHGVADVTPGRDPAAHSEAAAEDVLTELSAIRRAVEAAEARAAEAPAP